MAAMTLNRKSMDMTTGPLFTKLLRFIIPLILTNLLQQLYHAADIMVVGLSSDPDAVGAIGSTGTYLGLITNLFIGFSVGAGVVTARCIGARDAEGTSRAAHTALCRGVLFGLGGSALGMLLAEPILVAMGYTGHLLELALRYAYIFLACMPFSSMTNFLCAILRAKGNTRTSLLVLSATGVLNILLNLFFVLVLDFSVEGVAIATGIANLTSAVILWSYLAREKDDCRLSFRNLRISKKEFKEIARVGFPAGIQNALFAVSNILIQSSILEVNSILTPPGSAYSPVIKGNSALGSIENFIFTALSAISSAASNFTSQNVGCKNYRRVYRVLWQLSIIGSGVALIMSFGGMLIHEPLLRLYGVENVEETLGRIAYETAFTRMIMKWPYFVFYAILNICAGMLRGLGRSTVSAVISFVGTCVFRVVWIYTIYETFGTLESIYVSYPISWFLTGVCFLATVLIVLKKRSRAVNAPEAQVA